MAWHGINYDNTLQLQSVTTACIYDELKTFLHLKKLTLACQTSTATFSIF